MVKAQHDGSEVVTEVTVFPDGKEVTKETVRPKGKQTPTSSSNENSGNELVLSERNYFLGENLNGTYSVM